MVEDGGRIVIILMREVGNWDFFLSLLLESQNVPFLNYLFTTSKSYQIYHMYIDYFKEGI